MWGFCVGARPGARRGGVGRGEAAGAHAEQRILANELHRVAQEPHPLPDRGRRSRGNPRTPLLELVVGDGEPLVQHRVGRQEHDPRERADGQRRERETRSAELRYRKYAKSTSSTMCPVRPGTISSTLTRHGRAERAERPPAAARLRVHRGQREQVGGERHEHVVRDVRLERDGVEHRPLEPRVDRKRAEPEQVGQEQRHEHRGQERRDAALAPSGSRISGISAGMQQQPQCLRQRVEHVPGRADRVEGSRRDEREQRQRGRATGLPRTAASLSR